MFRINGSFHFILLTPIFIVIFIGGCVPGQDLSPKVDYYTLEYDPPKIESLQPLGCVLQVEEFDASPFYYSNRIVYRDGQFKRDTYVYHKWRAKPGDLVPFYLTRDIKASLLFKAVIGKNSKAFSSHLIEGTVVEFFEWDENKSCEAVLTLSVILTKKNEPDISKRILLQKEYTARQACAKRNPHALADAMSRAMAAVSESIIKDIHGHLSRECLPM